MFDPATILSLISDLYAQVAALQRENASLHEALSDSTPDE